MQLFYIRLKIEGFKPRASPLDETHPDWKTQACLVFKDHNVLQEGFRQAQIITNTVCLSNSFSNYVQDSLPDLSENVDDIVKRYIKFSFSYIYIIYYMFIHHIICFLSF